MIDFPKKKKSWIDLHAWVARLQGPRDTSWPYPSWESVTPLFGYAILTASPATTCCYRTPCSLGAVCGPVGNIIAVPEDAVNFSQENYSLVLTFSAAPGMNVSPHFHHAKNVSVQRGWSDIIHLARAP